MKPCRRKLTSGVPGLFLPVALLLAILTAIANGQAVARAAPARQVPDDCGPKTLTVKQGGRVVFELPGGFRRD